MNKEKVKEIIKFTFYKNIQNRWFIIFNVITLVSIVLMVNWGSISSLFKIKEDIKVFEIEVLDNSGVVYEEFLDVLSGDGRFEITRISENDYNAENIRDDLMILEIIPDEKEIFKVAIVSKEGIDVQLYNPIKDTLVNLRNNLFGEKYGVSNEKLKVLQSDLSIDRIMLAVDAEASSMKEMIKLFSSAFTYLLTTFIFSKMANEIASEKQSKSTEYILTTVSAKEYLFAKVFANITILLIQGLFVFVYYFIAVAIMNIVNIYNTDLNIDTLINVSSMGNDMVLYIMALIIYNVLNLILLSIIQATLSSKTSSTSEAGNTVSITLLVMMLAYISTIAFIRPESKINLLLYMISCLPLLSAYFVPGMIVIGQATWLQIVVSLSMLIISIPITFNICSKIFKNGILDYTKIKKKVQKERVEDDERKRFLIKRDMKNLGFVIGLAIIIYIGMQTILSLLGGIVLPTIFGNVLTKTDITLVLQIILQVISLGISSIFVLSYVNKKDIKEKRNINSKNKVKILFISILMIFGLQFILSLVIYPAIGLDYSTTDMFDVNSKSSLISKIILVIAVAVTPAIFEELFFRKAIIDFTMKYGKNFALVFSALIFGILHMNLAQGLFAFIAGIIFGSIYLYTRDIKFTMLIHFINNGIAVLEMILPERGTIFVAVFLIICLVIGVVLLMVTLLKKESREKVEKLCKIPVSIDSFGNKYKYIFTDFTFNISMILVFLMSVLTENMLR